MYLSKAYFRSKDYTSCKKLTVQLLNRHPNDLRLKFNLAYCLYVEAQDIFNLTVRRVKQTRDAMANLSYAKSLFQQFIDISATTGGQQT